MTNVLKTIKSETFVAFHDYIMKKFKKELKKGRYDSFFNTRYIPKDTPQLYGYDKKHIANKKPNIITAMKETYKNKQRKNNNYGLFTQNLTGKHLHDKYRNAFAGKDVKVNTGNYLKLFLTYLGLDSIEDFETLYEISNLKKEIHNTITTCYSAYYLSSKEAHQKSVIRHFFIKITQYLDKVNEATQNIAEIFLMRNNKNIEKLVGEWKVKGSNFIIDISNNSKLLIHIILHKGVDNYELRDLMVGTYTKVSGVIVSRKIIVKKIENFVESSLPEKKEPSTIYQKYLEDSLIKIRQHQIYDEQGLENHIKKQLVNWFSYRDLKQNLVGIYEIFILHKDSNNPNDSNQIIIGNLTINEKNEMDNSFIRIQTNLRTSDPLSGELSILSRSIGIIKLKDNRKDLRYYIALQLPDVLPSNYIIGTFINLSNAYCGRILLKKAQNGTPNFKLIDSESLSKSLDESEHQYIASFFLGHKNNLIIDSTKVFKDRHIVKFPNSEQPIGLLAGNYKFIFRSSKKDQALKVLPIRIENDGTVLWKLGQANNLKYNKKLPGRAFIYGRNLYIMRFRNNRCEGMSIMHVGRDFGVFTKDINFLWGNHVSVSSSKPVGRLCFMTKTNTTFEKISSTFIQKDSLEFKELNKEYPYKGKEELYKGKGLGDILTINEETILQQDFYYDDF